MPRFFNSSRSPVTATVGTAVIMFPAKQWTLVDENLGISGSIQSLVDQRVLVLSKDASPLTAAVASKPRSTPAAKKASAEASSKESPAKAIPPKDASKSQTLEPAPAPAPPASKV